MLGVEKAVKDTLAIIVHPYLLFSPDTKPPNMKLVPALMTMSAFDT